MLKKFKITYWLDGDKRVKEILASSKYNAKMRFYLTHSCDEIIEIEEVKE